jgi:hypothetical protein
MVRVYPEREPVPENERQQTVLGGLLGRLSFFLPLFKGLAETKKGVPVWDAFFCFRKD